MIDNLAICLLIFVNVSVGGRGLQAVSQRALRLGRVKREVVQADADGETGMTAWVRGRESEDMTVGRVQPHFALVIVVVMPNPRSCGAAVSTARRLHCQEEIESQSPLGKARRGTR